MCVRFFIALSFFLCGSVSYSHNYRPSLKDLEKIAIEKAPELEELHSSQDSLESSAMAAGTLKDPKLQAGLLNLPTDTFSTTQENMTQIKFGIIQEFPRGNSLSLRKEQLRYIATSKGFKKSAVEAEILRTVRMNYIELFFLTSAKKILKEATRVFSHLVKVTTSTLSAGKGFQHDVLKAQLDLTEIERKLLQVDEDIRIIRANLARFVGNNMAQFVEPRIIPRWDDPGKLSNIHESLNHHPMIRMEDSLVNANKKGVEIAKEQYKPAWSLGAHYSIRQGYSGSPRQRRKDFFGLQLTTELPLFTSNRQDKRVIENVEKHKASKHKKTIHLLNLRKEAEEYYATWEQLKAQEKIYKHRLVPEAKQYAKATLNAYENTQVDFPTVARAHDTSLMTRLQFIRIQTKRQKARAYLLYLEAK